MVRVANGGSSNVRPAGNEAAQRVDGLVASRVSALLQQERTAVVRGVGAGRSAVYEYENAETPEKHSNVIANMALRRRVGDGPIKRRSPPRRVSRRAAPA
jgi:hypothetical protein